METKFNLTSSDDAHAIWQAFNNKYAKLDMKAKKQLFSKPNKFREEFSKFLGGNLGWEEDLERLFDSEKSYWKESQSLLKVDPQWNFTSNFKHLLNYDEKTNNQVEISHNFFKLDELLQAITWGNWNDPIFMDPTLPQLALSLYMAEKITQQQIFTILERHQTFKDFPLIATYPILDKNGQFTPEAEKFLLPQLTNRFYLRELSANEIEQFRLMIAALPRSEQIFYTTELGKLAKFNFFREYFGIELFRRDSLFISYTHDCVVHLSSGAKDALGLMRFGLEQYVRLIPRFGQQKLADIEHGMKHEARYAAIHYPKTKSHENTSHGYINVTDLEATSHDIYHSNVSSTIPKNFLSAMWRFVDIAREKTDYLWSKETWDFVDAEYLYWFSSHKRSTITPEFIQTISNIEVSSESFCCFLSYGNNSSGDVSGIITKGTITPVGIFIFIDMLKNREKWIELNIDPEKLIGSLKTYYSIAKEIYEDIKNDDPKIQLLKYQLYLHFTRQENPNAFRILNKIIDENKDHIQAKLAFGKIKKSDATALDLENSIYLTYDKHRNIEKTAIDILSYSYIKQHPGLPSDSKEIQYYCTSVAVLGHTQNETERYIKLRSQGLEDEEAQFRVNPSLTNWINSNYLAVGLCCASIIGIIFLFYGIYQSYKQEELNQQMRAGSANNFFHSPVSQPQTSSQETTNPNPSVMISDPKSPPTHPNCNN